MSSADTRPVQRSWLARGLRLGAISLATLLLVLIIAVVWLLSPLGLGFVLGQARQVVADGGGTLVTEQAEGSLWSGVRVARLSWTDGNTEVQAEQLVTRWQLSKLLGRHLQIDQVEAARIDVKLPASSGEPEPRQAIEMPGSFELPITIAVDRLAVGELALKPADAQAEPLLFSGLQVGLSYAESTYRISPLELRSPWASLSDVELTFGAKPPHAIALQGKVAGEVPLEQPRPATATLNAQGDLNQLSLAVHGRALKSFAELNATLRPLALSPLTAADLKLSEFGLKELGQELPAGSINLTATVRTTDEQARPLPGWALGLQLENSASGRLESGQLPLDALSLAASISDPTVEPVRQIQLRDIDIRFAGTDDDQRGRISGQADIDLGEQQTIAGVSVPIVQSQLNVQRIDLTQFASEELKTALSGQISIARDEFDIALNQAGQTAESRKANPQAYLSSLPAGDASLVARGRIDQDRLQLGDVRLAVGDTELAVFGSAQVASPYQLDLGGKIVKLDLARWIPASVGVPPRWRQGLIYGGWSAQGAIKPAPDLSLALNIDSSRLAGQPLQAKIQAGLKIDEQGRLQLLNAVDSLLRLGSNRLTLKGGLAGIEAAGTKNPSLAFKLDIKDPAAIEPTIGGTATVAGELTGSLNQLRVAADLAGRSIRVKQAGQAPISLRRLDGRLEMPVVYPPAPDAPILISSRLSRLRAGGQTVSSAGLEIKGTTARHRIDFNTAVAGQKLDLTATGKVALQNAPVWVGTIDRLISRGKVTVQSSAPMQLLASAQNIRIADADLTVRAARSDRGRISIEQAVAALGDKPAFTVRGNLAELPVAQLAGAFQANPLPDELLGLRLSSEFQLSGSGVEDLTGQLSAKLREVGETRRLKLGGRNEASFRFELGKLDGDIDLTLPSLAFSKNFTGPGWVIDGRASLAGVVGGTVVKPTYDVQLTGTDLSLLQPSLGWRLDKGALRAQISDRNLSIEALRLQTGEGRIELTGQAALLPPSKVKGASSALPIDGRFALNTSGFVVPIGPGQRLVLSGKTQLVANPQGLTWRGDMQADEGLIEIAGSGAPSLPSDVEIVSASKPAAPEPAPDDEESDAGIKVDTLLNINLGENLRVQGGGVNARLTGLLQLKGTLPADPRAEGLVKIVDGSYRAYSQDLQINDGDVRFNGPIDNPALNIEAIRPKLPVTVGVAIRGTALSPRIELFSDPSMSDAEKLSWLVLGVPIDNAQGGAQSLALKEAASRLLGQDDGSVSGGGFSDKLGLDSFGFGYASETGQAQGVRDSGAPTGLPGAGGQTSAAAYQEVVTLGKKLTDRLSVSYEQGVRGLFNLLRVQYELNQRLSLRAQTGSENAVDLLYFWSFD